jgi:hypothetical protein
MVGRHRKGDKANRGNGGSGIPEPKARYRVEYHDENGEFASLVAATAVERDEIVKDLRRRKLQYHVVNL